MKKVFNCKIKFSKSFVVFISLTIFFLLTLAGLTKADYIENYLDIEILCPKPKVNPYNGEDPFSFKPVIYLYPEEITEVKVELNYKGTIIADYPDYDHAINGWEVLASPDGRLINKSDNQEYSYLFWEGESDKPVKYDLSSGFIVEGGNIETFLQKKLSEIGLTPNEYNEFIVYWYPKMKNNNYNLIHFAEQEYTDSAPLNITPKPDSILRVFMVFKSLDNKIDIAPQIIPTFKREGFSVIEWGGTEIKS